MDGKGLNKKNIIIFIGIVLVAVLFILGRKVISFEDKKHQTLVRQEMKEREKLEKEYMFDVGKSNEWDLDNSSFEIVENTDNLIRNVEKTSGYQGKESVTFHTSKNISNQKHIYMIAFVAWVEKESTKLVVRNGEKIESYSIVSQPTAYYIPMTDNVCEIYVDKVVNQGVHLYNPEIIKIKGKNKIQNGTKIGEYNLAKHTEYKLTNKERLVKAGCRDTISDNNYLYILTSGEMVVYSKNNKNHIVGAVKNLGNTSHLAFVNRNTIVVTSRQNGVFFIDISNPKSPKIISTYSALDLATGIETAGNYVFIFSRYLGVEIVDVSDIKTPKLCSVINTGGECINGAVDGKYIYISNWNAKKIYVYEISDINSPKEITTIDTDGNPYGIKIKKDNLFVATGHHSSQDLDLDDKTSPGYGAGHGMEIYDISDVSRINLKSIVKADGRLYYPAIDSWGVYISGKYAFLSSTYNGVFVYDVSDVENPKRVAVIQRKIKGMEDDQVEPQYIFPYNPQKYMIDPISGITFGENEVYLACQDTGFYKLDMDFQIGGNDSVEESFSYKTYNGSFFNSFSSVKLLNHDSKVLSGYGVVNAIDTYKNKLIIACGDNGGYVIDDNGKILSNIKTKGAAKDIIVYNNKVYIAEGNFGMEIYSLDNNGKASLINQWKNPNSQETVSQIKVLKNGKYLLMQMGWSKVKVLDISNVTNIKEVKDILAGTLYFRNLFNQDDDTSVVGYGSNQQVGFLNVSEGTIKEKNIKNSIYEERNGSCIYNGMFISVYRDGYIAEKIDKINSNTKLDELPQYTLKGDYKIRGKIVCNDGVMVATDSYSRKVSILNIKDIQKPELEEEFFVDGNVDIAKITSDYIYIPLKYQGVLVIKR